MQPGLPSSKSIKQRREKGRTAPAPVPYCQKRKNVDKDPRGESNNRLARVKKIAGKTVEGVSSGEKRSPLTRA